jgi:hypothetical protein
MKVKIEIVGQVEATEDLRKETDKILDKYFKSFKFNWELLKGLEK